MTPRPLEFPGADGPAKACIEQGSGARPAVIVVADPDDAGAAEELRSALVEAGFSVVWLPPESLEATDGEPSLEDLASLLGTLFVSSRAPVDLVASGKSCPVALATVEGAHELVAAAVLVGAADEVVDAAHDVPVPLVTLDTAAAPAAVVEALAQ